MTRSRVACSLALAAVGLGASAAYAQNVTAFNPYNGTGISASPAPSANVRGYGVADVPRPSANVRGYGAVDGPRPAANVRGYGVVDVPPPNMNGPAFNPWRAADNAGPAWEPAAPMAQNPSRAPAAGGYGSSYGGTYGAGSYLPPPPPGALESRIMAIPERDDGTSTRRSMVAPPMPAPIPVPETPPSTATVAPPPAAPAPVPVTRAVPPPLAAAPPTPVATPAPPPAQVATPAPTPAAPLPAATPAPPPPAVAATPPPPEPKSSRPAANEARPAPPASGAPTVSILFGTNSAEISDVAKADLDRVAKTISQQRMSQIELRAFAGGADPAEARKVALARALAVRSYLIDQGVKARIEVGAFSAARASGPGERVDVLAPGP